MYTICQALPVIYTLYLILAAFLFSPVAGHGYIHTVTVGGQDYQGWMPFSDDYANPAPAKVMRRVHSDGPVSTGDTNLNCNIDGNDPAALVAVAQAGSQVVFDWSYWPADHQGPVLTYMASCNGDCTTFQSINAQWFKLDAGGYNPDTKLWAADELRANGNKWTSTIPAELAPGQYLIRNEIVALHSVIPQFYPSCTQLNVTGTGTKQPAQSELATLPAFYNTAVWPTSIYSDFGTFTIPGPPVVSFASGGDSSPPPASSASAPAASASVKPTGTKTLPSSTATAASGVSTAPSGQCYLRARRLVRRRR